MRYLIALIAERLLDDRQRRLLDKYYRKGRHCPNSYRSYVYIAWAGTSGEYA